MNVFQEAVNGLPEIRTLTDALETDEKRHERHTYGLSGVPEGDRTHLVYALGSRTPVRLVIMESDSAARACCDEYTYFDESAVFYPAKDLLFYQSDIRSNELVGERIRTMREILSGKPLTIFTTAEALMNRMPSPEMFRSAVIKIEDGGERDPEELTRSLVDLGYEPAAAVEGPGEFSIRGGIVDVFPLTEQRPFRIEFFGDEVDSIRIFDVTTQKSIGRAKEAVIYPAREVLFSGEDLQKGLERIRRDGEKLCKKFRSEMKTEEAFRLKSRLDALSEELEAGTAGQQVESYLPYFAKEMHSLIDYLPEQTMIFYDEPMRLSDNADSCEKEFMESMERRAASGDLLPEQRALLLPAKSLWEKCAQREGVTLSMLDFKKGPVELAAHFYLHAVSTPTYSGQFSMLVDELKKYRSNKYRIVVLSPSRTRARRISQDLADSDILSFYSESCDQSLHPGEVLVTVGGLRSGVEFPDSRWAFITEQDIFGSRRKKKRRRLYEGEKIHALAELSVGDYVVHENYGLGIYQGMEKIEHDHVTKDYIKISYAKGSNLYILATQFDRIGKYDQVGDRKPKLSVLGGKEWKEKKARVRGAVAEVAKDLVRLYAARQEMQGNACAPDDEMQREFEETFPYEETDGQLQAIRDVKRDMESDRIMDRLICGDVGYGKTEIALRAAFKAVENGFQVAFLAPTTILAQQHYNTFVSRMSGYPISVDLMCRFRTDRENRAIAKRLRDGSLDIAIGTHRLLSSDVSFKNLGLLIIDEEQRFGVRHKERIKELKKNVDVLALSATPIPRTLHMSLVGIRDMSVLEEAPMERTPIQTFVFEQNDEMVREAISRELSRGGQVYYVINNIRMIETVTEHLREMLPDASIEYAHGRMGEKRLEDIMTSFINRDIDVLVATTIIEIGLDISNVNTIIIHDADRFGLSQLYQLRGRVGRSNRTAYAFLMYRRDKVISEVAQKRLAAIREFTDLGSGFRIAMRDLEIRGAGALLGEAQSGHMEEVGYDLYCKLLSEAVRAEKGEETVRDFETVIDLDMDAFIPSSYIEDEEQKLEMYRRISQITDAADRRDVCDLLIDRFGDPPAPVLNLLEISRLKSAAHDCDITEIKQKGGRFRVTFAADAHIDPGKIPDFVEHHAPYLSVTPDPKGPYFTYRYSADPRKKKKDLPEFIASFVGEIKKSLAVVTAEGKSYNKPDNTAEDRPEDN